MWSIYSGAMWSDYPAYAYGYRMDKKTKKRKFVILKTLLFGDYIKPVIENGNYVSITEKKRTYIKVHCRSKDGYILPSKIQPNKIVEVNFTDVGQGDGCPREVRNPWGRPLSLNCGAESMAAGRCCSASWRGARLRRP